MDNYNRQATEAALCVGAEDLRRHQASGGLGAIPDRPQNPVGMPAEARPVNIHKLLRGWIVQIGCQSVAFETLDKMMFEVGRYLRNPADVEKEYLQKA